MTTSHGLSRSPAAPLLFTGTDGAELILDESVTRLRDSDHLLEEIARRGTTEDLHALLAEYVREEKYLLAFLADSAIRTMERGAQDAR